VSKLELCTYSTIGAVKVIGDCREGTFRVGRGGTSWALWKMVRDERWEAIERGEGGAWVGSRGKSLIL